MKNKYLLVTALVTITFVLVGLGVPSIRDRISELIYPQSALASSDQDHYVYIPMIANSYPIATSFGTEMEPWNRVLGLDMVKQTNTSWIRQNGLVWSFVEPTKGARDWDTMADLDAAIIEATKNNIGTVMIVRNTPTWAQSIPGIYCGPIKPEELQAFGQFMYDAVARYSKPPYNVKVWEVWNEPDVPPTTGGENRVWGCWGDLNDPYYGGGYFAEMLKAVYPQMKAADPEAQVFIGGLLLDCDPRPQSNYCAYYNKDERPPKFLEGILLNGGANYFDGVAFHGYDYFNQMNPSLGFYVNLAWGTSWDTTGPVSLSKASYVRYVLDKYNVTGKMLMNTETALVCGAFGEPPGSTGCESDDNSYFEQTKARYVPQAYAAGIKENLVINIWYTLLGWRNSNLLNKDLTPRPAYYAYQFASRQFLDATFVREITDYPGVRAYEFQNSQHRFWVVWSMDAGGHTINLPNTPGKVYDFLGNAQTPSSSITITLDTLYIVW